MGQLVPLHQGGAVQLARVPRGLEHHGEGEDGGEEGGV
jgi:hypothetical protein